MFPENSCSHIWRILRKATYNWSKSPWNIPVKQIVFSKVAGLGAVVLLKNKLLHRYLWGFSLGIGTGIDILRNTLLLSNGLIIFVRHGKESDNYFQSSCVDFFMSIYIFEINVHCLLGYTIRKWFSVVSLKMFSVELPQCTPLRRSHIWQDELQNLHHVDKVDLGIYTNLLGCVA